MRLLAIILMAALLAMPADARPRRDYIDEEEEEEAQPLTVHMNKPIVEFEVLDLGGINIKTKDFRKSKFFLLHISNTKVEVNKTEIGIMNDLIDKYAGKVVVLDVVTKDPTPHEELLDYYERVNAKFTPAVDPEGKVVKALGMIRLPLTVLATPNGKVLYISERADFRVISAAIERANNDPFYISEEK